MKFNVKFYEISIKFNLLEHIATFYFVLVDLRQVHLGPSASGGQGR